MKKIEDIVRHQIECRKETSNLDFKQEWHKDFTHLLKDVICMANSIDSKDSYIVIGVTDDFEIVGVKKDSYTQADISSSLRNYTFAGGSIPKINLLEIYIDNKRLAILEIKSSNEVPYYLSVVKKNSANLKENVIYTRSSDSNTEASFSEVEMLWKKRFNLHLTEEDRFLKLLNSPDDWESNNNDFYYKYDNKFQIKFIEVERQSTTPPFYAYIIDNWGRFELKTVELRRNGNSLCSFQEASLDGCRVSIITPDNLFYGKKSENKIQGRSYTKGSLKDALTNFIYKKDELEEKEERQLHIEELNESFIVFESEEDKAHFKDFIESHENEFRKELSTFSHITYSDIPKHCIFEIRQSVLLKNWYLEKYKPYKLRFNSI